MNTVEFDYYITPDGVTYNLRNLKKVFILSGDNFGMPPIDYLTFRGPFQHGESVSNFLLQPRVIQYTIRLQGCSRNDYYTNRNVIMDMLRPNRQYLNTLSPGILRKILSDGRKRDINVFVESGPSFSFSNTLWDEFGSTNVVRFIAHDPTFFDPTSSQVSFASVYTGELVFPITFPITFGGSTIYDTSTISYTGTWMTFPTITIQGPAGNLEITNTSINEKIQFEYLIPSGRTVTIDLRYGYKTVTDDIGNNLIGTLTPDSDLATFAIHPHPTAPNGQNVISVKCYGTTEDTEISLQYNERYIGI